jgi:hypothetical protein
MNNKSILEQALKICRNLLDINPPETIEKIRDSISKVSMILQLTDEDKEYLLSRLIEVTGVDQAEPRILDNDNVNPWILSKWSENADNRKFWSRYRDYLAEDKKIAPKVISRLDELTDKILDRLADPDAHDQFDKRGLVVGHVQSGKTSNYVGLITKAADAGYKLIVVLAGIHSTLRSQTQLRIDEGFLGYDTVTNRSFNENNNLIGVGKIDPNAQAHSLTSSSLNGDFKRGVAEAINVNLRGSDPVIIVIKKNTSILKNLIHWLSGKIGENYGDNERIINNISLLLIDDEADNASINISKSSVSSINGSIRALLQLFRKSAYVGYTATPYANVFIPTPEKSEELHKGIKLVLGNRDYLIGEDLFPRDFIINIPPPSNYIGPERFFGIVSENDIYEEPDVSENNPTGSNSILKLYVPVNDYQPIEYFDNKNVVESIQENNLNFIPDRHQKDDSKPLELPESLKKALKCFILACAARRVRGQINVHNSMLVHVTRFISWQNHIALLIIDELDRYRNRIEFRSSDFYEELKKIWETDFIPKTEEISALPDVGGPDITPVSWDRLSLELLPAVTKIRVRAVHGSTLLGGLEQENIQPVDYYENQKKGLSVIAVGGNKLSRGLTLEGLSVSYFLRASKMYDTLMQMGRWFGYRPGYLDLCRLFTSNDLVSYYKHITVVTEEMRAEFDRMWLLHEKPLNYGLKIRAHAGILTITAANKFRYKKMMSFGFSGELEETWQFDRKNKDIFEKNYKVTQELISALGPPKGAVNLSKYFKGQPYVWHGENNYSEIINYLAAYLTSQPSFRTGLIIDYILKQVKNGKLTDWTIALINNSKATTDNTVNFSGKEVGLSFRRDDAENGSQYYELTKAHIIGSFHEYIDLADNEIHEAMEATSLDRIKEGKETGPEHPNPLRIRKNRPENKALLLVYPLDTKPNKEEESYSNVPIIGLALSFPYIKDEEKVLYAVNEVFQKELYDYPDELDIEDLASENEDDNDSKTISTHGNNLSEESFLSLIENSYILYLDETEFFSGIVPEYSQKKNIIKELKQRSNLVVSSEDDNFKSFNSVPFYSENDIQQYYLKFNPGHVLLSGERNKEENRVISEECIVGLKRSKYVTFCYHNKPSAFSDSCWIIKSGRFNARYLVALFNSTLFGAWVRVKGEQKKDTYFIKNEVIYSFPLIFPEKNKLWIYENLYELLIAVGKKEQAQGTGTIKSYFANVLDALIFTCYFPGSMKNESEKLYEELEKLIPRRLPSENIRAVLAEELFKVIYDRKHPIRETIYYLDVNNKVDRIKSVFMR